MARVAEAETATETVQRTDPEGRSTMSAALPDAMNYHRWINSLVTPHLVDPVLEVGVGYGQYTRELIAQGREIVGIDIAQDLLDALSDTGIERHRCDISSDGFVEQVGENRFGSIVCLNVVEHIDDHVATLARFRRVLRPGGVAFVLVPAHQTLYGPMDEMAGHYRRYSRRMLATAMTDAGLDVQTVRYFNPIGGLGWWVNAKFCKPKDLSDDSINTQIRLYDKYAQPVSRLVNPLSSRLFGQSVWAVATRRA